MDAWYEAQAPLFRHGNVVSQQDSQSVLLEGASQTIHTNIPTMRTHIGHVGLGLHSCHTDGLYVCLGPNAVTQWFSQLSLPMHCYTAKGSLLAALILQPWVRDNACKAYA